MTRRRKVLLSVLSSAAALLVLLAAVGWWWIGRPMYTPGDVRASAIATPGPQTESGYWTVEPGIRLRYFASGAGRNVLFVHGGPGFPTRTAPPGLELLKDRFRVYYYDQRGCGGSTRPFDRFTSSNYGANLTALESKLGLGAQIADIERIRRILGDRRIILVGHSFGGLLAALYAAEFPDNIDSLVLIAPAPLLEMPVPEGDVFAQIERRLPPERRAAYDTWRRGYFDFRSIFAKSEKQLMAQHAAFAEFFAAAGRAQPDAPRIDEAGGWMVWAQYFSLGRRHDWRGALEAVAQPALVLHGDRDLQPETATRAFSAALPASTFEVIRGAGHFPHIEKPEAFAAAVGKFLPR